MLIDENQAPGSEQDLRPDSDVDCVDKAKVDGYPAHPMISPLNVFKLLLLIYLLSLQSLSYGHGSVTADADLCIIKIGYYSAHFKIYLPRSHGHKDYCEDLPDNGETVFVMEYTYGDLGEVPVDFRIIRDVTGMGRFAQLQDVEALSQTELEAATVVYRAPTKQPDIYAINHYFEESGNYLGIVTARHPQTNELYTAVFPFEVGYVGFGYLPLFILLIIVFQGAYWWMNREKKSRVKN